jgi:hypothetical protein
VQTTVLLPPSEATRQDKFVVGYPQRATSGSGAMLWWRFWTMWGIRRSRVESGGSRFDLRSSLCERLMGSDSI